LQREVVQRRTDRAAYISWLISGRRYYEERQLTIVYKAASTVLAHTDEGADPVEPLV
jgi:hypothetical protein